jgi:arsenate reductase
MIDLPPPYLQQAKADSQTVVFVCEHGTVKSVLALAWFRKYAAERGLAVRAVSRGTALDPAIPAPVIAGMQREGISPGPFTPTLFSDSDIAKAALVVSFDNPDAQSRAAGRTKTSGWNNLPAVSADYRVASDTIRARVKRLVDSLAAMR